MYRVVNHNYLVSVAHAGAIRALSKHAMADSRWTDTNPDVVSQSWSPMPMICQQPDAMKFWFSNCQKTRTRSFITAASCGCGVHYLPSTPYCEMNYD